MRQALLNEDWDAIPNHITIAKSLESWAMGKFAVVDGVVRYDGKALPISLNQRIISMVTNGESPSSLFNFWERLQKNPSYRSVHQLWGFLEHANIPLTSNGCFLAYKSVRQDYKDYHSNLFDNSPGVTNEMPRNEISDDPDLACHEGFHVGALGYVSSFYPGGRIVVCRIDPKDVVCVPKDARQQKVRVCKYTVIGNYGTDLPSTVFDDPPVVEEDDEEEVDDIEDELAKAEEEDELSLEREMGVEAFVHPEQRTKSVGGRTTSVAIGTATSTKVTKKPNKGYAKLNKMGLKELMERSLADLREYATYGLEITGASKIVGGKAALASKILEVRDGFVEEKDE